MSKVNVEKNGATSVEREGPPRPSGPLSLLKFSLKVEYFATILNDLIEMIGVYKSKNNLALSFFISPY